MTSMSKPFIVTYRSDRKTHKDMRRIAKTLLRKHLEPEPRYATGKYWND